MSQAQQLPITFGEVIDFAQLKSAYISCYKRLSMNVTDAESDDEGKGKREEFGPYKRFDENKSIQYLSGGKILPNNLEK